MKKIERRHGIRATGAILIIGIIIGCSGIPETKTDTIDRSSDTITEKNKETAPAESLPGPEMTEPEKTEPYAESRPTPTDLSELTVVMNNNSLELDPRRSYTAQEAQIFTALYEGLFSYHPLTMEPVPALAARWEVSEDKKTWTFTIREGAKYWNGDPVRSGDFRDAWLSLIEPQRNSPYASLFDCIAGARQYRLGTISDRTQVGIQTPDDRTLVLKLEHPASYLPSMLCHHAFSPIHPRMIQEKDWSKRVPISNGPFYIVSQENSVLTLAKNELYWDARRVALKKLTIRFTDDAQEAAQFWNTGRARWIAGDVDLEKLQDRSGIVVNALFATNYYFIKSKEAPWNDYRVRQALALTIPWAEVRKPYYLPAETLIFPIPGYPKVTALSETNPEKARALLTEAGFGKEKPLPPITILITAFQESRRIATLMKEAWEKELTAQVRIREIPSQRYYDALKEESYVIGATTWIGDFADPYTFLHLWQRESNLNDASLSDGDFEDLMNKSLILEGEERWKVLAQAEELLLQRAVVLPISHPPALNVIDMNEIEGWYPNPLDIHPFKYLRYSATKALPGVAKGNIPLEREPRGKNRKVL
ncbi:peptide ABC transporter substrate-binding protein [Treponema sp. J25]|uniref:peptide ABC transporter substrate-binding protein n=1 Tax=Treponema sp. J25 TaxID=2094121 RepID=UPI001FB647B1|nr:peptide ABC transporter substrate-binding protein [Treponema sp. J25]